MEKKLFISADIEGSCGICHWDETELADTYFRTEMTKEVAAACDGATDAGYSSVTVKDAHDSARNIYPDMLPRCASVIRNWTGDPLCMVSGLDKSFTACAFTGYHSPAFSGGSPLAHTMTTTLQYIKLNGEFASEFMLNAYACEYIGVPVVFVSGDAYLCGEVKKLNPHITCVVTNTGIGGASLAVHPEAAREAIREGVSKALSGDISLCRLCMPEHFVIEVQYKKQATAYTNSFFPGARLKDPCTVTLESDDYRDILVFMNFCA